MASEDSDEKIAVCARGPLGRACLEIEGGAMIYGLIQMVGLLIVQLVHRLNVTQTALDEFHLAMQARELSEARR